MHKKLTSRRAVYLTLFAASLFWATDTSAQLSLDGQLRSRGEIRNGTGTLRPVTSDAAAFISQRTRLNFNYKGSKVNFRASVQDVRVWGQDASTINNSDGSRLGIYEAWADITLSNKSDSTIKNSPFDYFSVKLGRQELMYDDSRLLGNLDWLQQGRRHDAIVFKLSQKGWQLDLGAAFNQNTDAFNYNGTFYTPANIPVTVKDSRGVLTNTPAGILPLVNATGVSAKNGNPAFANAPSTNAATQNYKALEYLYVAKSFHKTKISGLLFMDQFGKYNLDSVANPVGAEVGYIYGRRFNQKGANTRITTGLLLNSPLDAKGKFGLTAGGYYQGGKDRDALSLNAFTTTFALSYTPSSISYTAGWDYLSGNSSTTPTTENHRFDPLYGTPHKFWGLMDYFYAGTGSPAGGLNNPHFKIRYASKNKRFATGLDYHYFAFANTRKDINGNDLDKYLGSEFDLITSYNLNKITNVEVGLAYLAASKSMEYAKALTPNSTKLNNSWAYLQINIKPDFFSK